MLNHTLPVKLDRSNYVLWRSQIDNVVFANGFEDFIDGTAICPEKELSPGVINPSFVAWRRQDRTILSGYTHPSHLLSWHRSLATIHLTLPGMLWRKLFHLPQKPESCNYGLNYNPRRKDLCP
jgi:hypothetical protein